MSDPSEQPPNPASESSAVNSALSDSGDEKGKRGNYTLIRGYEGENHSHDLFLHPSSPRTEKAKQIEQEQ